jgi:hypothetical protein
VGEEALVESQIEESIALVNALDRQGDSPTRAAWYFFPDANEWRLLIAGPTFDALLPEKEAQVYRNIAKAMESAQLAAVSIADVKVVRTDFPLLEATKFLIRTPSSGTVRAHFKDNTINGMFLKEMLVLRAA